MNDRRASLHCPVCRGLPMERLHPEGDADLALDCCRRCGGIWFDTGEVARLRDCHPQALLAKVELRPNAFPTLCPGCRSAVPRNDARCRVCQRPNRIDCPVCTSELTPILQGGLRIDACRNCRGTWFDNVELDRIWNTRVVAFAAARGKVASVVHRDRFLLEDVVWLDPVGEVTVSLVARSASSLPHAAQVLGHGAANLATAPVEGTGDLAGSVFEAIAGIIGGIFEGF